MGRYRPYALRFTDRLLQERADAEDVGQEALRSAVLDLHRFEPGRSFRHWLLQIVKNRAHDARRRAHLRHAQSLASEWATEDPVAPATPRHDRFRARRHLRAILPRELLDE